MGKKKKKANRQVVVFVTLVSVLTLTSALLLAIAPDPLRPDSSSLLFAIDTPESMRAIFQTQVPAKGGRWKYIYIHHSRTATGTAVPGQADSIGSGDHFVIGNGFGAADGQVQVCPRWDQQVSASPPAAGEIDPACISICLVGDFDRNVPTPGQLNRLTALVSALQTRLDIRGQDIVLLTQSASKAGMGQYFPISLFREELLP